MELPEYHRPQFRSLMALLWDKSKHFIKKAFTIILASTIIIWFLSHTSFSWGFLSDTEIDKSILASVGKFLQPIFTPLGFGSQLSSNGWVFIVAVITGLIAKENVIATFGTLALCLGAGVIDVEIDGGVSAVVAMVTNTGITVPALLSFIAFNMTTIPCFAAVAAARGEMPNKRAFKGTILFWLLTSFIVSTSIYLIGSWWWSSFIIIGMLALIIFIIRKIARKKGLTK
jgi:ferrous iron transport protein B